MSWAIWIAGTPRGDGSAVARAAVWSTAELLLRLAGRLASTAPARVDRPGRSVA